MLAIDELGLDALLRCAAAIAANFVGARLADHEAPPKARPFCIPGQPDARFAGSRFGHGIELGL